MLGDDHLTCRSSTHARRKQRSPDGRTYSRSYNHVAEVVVRQLVTLATQVQPLRVELYGRVKEVESDAIAAILASFLCVEAVKSASVVLVRVVVLDDHGLHFVIDVCLESTCNGSRIEHVVDLVFECLPGVWAAEVDPVVVCHVRTSISVVIADVV